MPKVREIAVLTMTTKCGPIYRPACACRSGAGKPGRPAPCKDVMAEILTPMPVKTIARPGVVFAVWGGRPTVADVDAIERLLEETASSSAEGRVVYVARIPSCAPAPDSIV